MQKPVPPDGGDRDRAAVPEPLDPAQRKAAPGQGRADRAAEMRPPLAPVEARPAEAAALAGGIGEVETEFVEKPGPGCGDRAAIGIEQDMTARGEMVGQGDAEPAGEMVVAGPRRTQRLVAHPCRPIMRCPRHRDRHDRLDQARDLGRGEPEIAVAPLPVAGQKPRIDQLCQMRARGLRGHMRGIGEFAGAQRAAVHQRREHVGARRIAEQCRDLGDVGGVCHGFSIARDRAGPDAERFGHGRSYGRTARRVFRRQ